ncbi:hypothetical protein D4Z93_06590 [Clostridium fermenticellae]|uniref:Peptidase C39-like domain-containing protein n=1 Tax=Clostridium fermenticellae TaxID=2068654 RepID=A0A386H3V6_9CLOT|nr:hypothetical protein [Clostridium fermenticellae]AYD40203.1 hypothetical protein D4Z93_06590 [Clostridium fermenticellae]
MIKRSISNLNLFKLSDEGSNKIYFGGNQEWYHTEWQRRSGCGPTAASNIIFYLNCISHRIDLGKNLNVKKNWIMFMESVWKYVTPTDRGIPSAEMFCDKVLKYAKSNNVDVKCYVCDVPQDKDKRPQILEIIKFLENALSNDSPVAFLNLCNGKENCLDSWHWVTIISLECSDIKDRIFVDILDGGSIKKIDLLLWYNTTKQGGGFVYFMNNNVLDRH